MRIYCQITGLSASEGPTLVQNQAALEVLHTQHPNWRVVIAEEHENASCILQTEADNVTVRVFEQAVQEAYNAQQFNYTAYVAANEEETIQSSTRTLKKTLVGDSSSSPSSPLIIPPNSPFNIEAKKYYVFNTTGNIMMVSTEESGQMAESVREVFEEVSVFFAAMTKAITNTPNPHLKSMKPYSLYDYEALEKVIGGSGLFMHITEEDIDYKTDTFGGSFGIELIEGLLGLSIGEGALPFAQSMMASIGKTALDIHTNSTSGNKKVANIIFICEYLLGMPAISAIVVYLDVTDTTYTVDVGPCYSTTRVRSEWKLHKDTYMFVTPKFIKEYSGDLDSAAGNLQYNIFVDYLKALVTGAADIVGVTTADGQKAPTQLDSTQTYYIVGANFGDTQDQSTISYGSTGTIITVAGWSDNIIGFTVSGTAITTATPVTLEINGKKYTTAGFTFKGNTNTPNITGVVNNDGSPISGSNFTSGTEYKITGTNFGSTIGQSSIDFGGANISIVSNTWKNTSVRFTVTGSNHVTTATPIKLHIGGSDYTSPGSGYTYTG